MKKIGASIVLDGEKSYREALRNIQAEQKELRSEMQLASATFSGQQNSLEALQNKYEILSKQIESQKDKVSVYAAALEDAKTKQSTSANAMEKYSAELRAAERELEELKNDTSSSTDAIEAQESKVRDLQAEMANAQKEYDKTSTAVLNWQTGLNMAESQLISMENELSKTEGFMKEAEASTKKCATSIDEFGKEEKKAEENTLSFGDVLKANLASEVVMAGLNKLVDLTAQAGEGLFELATNAANFADDVATLSTQTGVATDTIQALYYAEGLLDVSVSTVTSSMARNVRAMNSYRDGAASYVDAYNAINVSVMDANGNLRDAETVFWEVIDALGEVENATERDAIAMSIFGRSAQQLNTLVVAGSKGFQQMKTEAMNLGYVMDTETMDSLLGTSDAMERVSKAADTLKNQIGAELADEVEEGANRISDAIAENKDEIIEVAAEVIPDLVDGIEAVVDNLDVIIPVLAGLGTGFVVFKAGAAAVTLVSSAMAAYKTITESATVAQWAMNAAANANPYVLLASVILGVVAAVGTYVACMEEEQSEFESLMETYDQQLATHQEEVAARQTARESMENESQTIRRLRDELMSLNSKQSLTNTEQSRMVDLVNQLNSAMPDLNLAINEQTGHLASTNDELARQIEYQEALLYLGELQGDVNDVFAQRYDIENELTDLYAQLDVAAQHLAEHITQVTDMRNALFEGTAEGFTYDDYTAAYAETPVVKEEYNLISQQIQEREALLESLGMEYDVLTGKIEYYTDIVEGNTVAQQENTAAVVGWHGHAVAVNQEVADSLAALNAAYNEAKQAAYDSLTQQIGLFDELTIASDLTAEQMAQNLASQVEAMQTYQADMITAAALVEQGLMEEGLLGAIQEMGISGAGYLHELVTAAEEDMETFQEVNQNFALSRETMNNVSDTLAELKTSYTNAKESIMEEATTLQDDMASVQELMAEMFGDGWAAMMVSAEDEFRTGGIQLVGAAQDVSHSTILALNHEMGITEDGSTSTQGAHIGAVFSQSMADGILSGQSAIEEAITSVTNSALSIAQNKVNELNRLLGELAL